MPESPPISSDNTCATAGLNMASNKVAVDVIARATKNLVSDIFLNIVFIMMESQRLGE